MSNISRESDEDHRPPLYAGMRSPIEHEMFVSLFSAAPRKFWVDETKSSVFVTWNSERFAFILIGHRILTYRADFILVRGRGQPPKLPCDIPELGIYNITLAIECDGHGFHDRTKQQAAYDRSRDRELLQIGIPTIRFTGSEIVHSPELCADDAYRCLFALPDIARAQSEAREAALSSPESMGRLEEHW